MMAKAPRAPKAANVTPLRVVSAETATTDEGEASKATPGVQIVDVRERALSLAGRAFDTLDNIMQSGGSDTARLAAAREVLDRAGGKPRAGGAEAVGGPHTVTIRRFGADGRELGTDEDG
jgi:hypothetical protein